MIHVIATIEAQPGKREVLLAEIQRIVPLVRAEAGCIEYGPTVDESIELAVPVPQRPDVVTMIEKWESVEALKKHLGAEHMVEYRVRVRDIVAKVMLQVLRPV